MNSLEKRLGDCEVCGYTTAKYTCPKCEVKTCTLKCVNIHKKELPCDGIRDKTKYVPLSKFSNIDLLSDYRLLEDANRSVETLKKDKSKRFTRVHKDLPRRLHILKRELTSRKTKIQFLPANFTRHKENTTYVDFKTNIIYWHIDWIFVQAQNLKIAETKCDENQKLSHIFDKYLNPIQISNEQLKFYQSAGLNKLNLYLKAENKPGNKYYNLDSSLSLKECFKNKVIIEYPTIYVSFKDHNDIFDSIESDDEIVADCSNPAKFVAELIKADEKENTVNKGSLMFITEYSDDELLLSDEN